MQYKLPKRKRNALIDVIRGKERAGDDVTTQYLMSHGFRVRVYCLFAEGEELDPEKSRDGYRKFLEEGEKPDLILAADLPFVTLIARQVKEELALSCPILSWLHDPIERCETAGYGGIELLRLADLHLATSRRIENRLRRELPESVIYTVHEPVSAKNCFYSEDRRGTSLIFIGDPEDQKNLPVILKGLTMGGDCWTLRVIGEGETGISAQRPDLWEEAKDADFLVMTSSAESIPATAVEALLSGIPVISTPADGIVDLIRPGENGFLFPFGDSAAFAEILRLLENGKLPRPEPSACRDSAAEYEEEAALFDLALKLRATLEGRVLSEPGKFYGKDKISVIIGFYNSEKTIKACLDSLLDQTIGLPHLELVLVNDASPDRSREIVKEYEERFPDQILLIDCEKNGKLGTARNIGMDYASGDYLAFADSDDIAFPEMLEDLYLMAVIWNLEVTECGFLECPMDVRPEPPAEESERILFFTGSEAEQKDLLISNGFLTAGWRRLFKKSMVREFSLRFAEGIRMEDVHFSLPLFMQCRSFGRIKRNMYVYYQNPDSIMNSDKVHEYFMDVYETHRLTIEDAKRRGLFLKFREELAYIYLQKVYFGLTEYMEAVFQIFPEEPYREIKDYMDREFPEIRENPYLTEKDRQQLKQYEEEHG